MRVRGIDAVPLVQQLARQHGYRFFGGNTPYDLNIFGVRNIDRTAGQFDDLFGCIYRERPSGALVLDLWPGTTDPGPAYLGQPMNSAGTAIVVPGQYTGLWRLGRHKGVHPALVQVGPVRVYRDDNRDDILDMNPQTIQEGEQYGINAHRAGLDSSLVGRWSAGCQVWKRAADFEEMLTLARKQVQVSPRWDTYTYTLYDAAEAPLAQSLFHVTA